MRNLIPALVTLAQRVFRSSDQPEAPDAGVLVDMLILTGDENAYGVTVHEIIDSWTPDDRRAVEEWAAAVHLRARTRDHRAPPAVPRVIRERHAQFVSRQVEGG